MVYVGELPGDAKSFVSQLRRGWTVDGDEELVKVARLVEEQMALVTDDAEHHEELGLNVKCPDHGPADRPVSVSRSPRARAFTRN